MDGNALNLGLLSSPPLPAGLVDRVPTGGVTGLTATGGAPTSLQAPTPPHAHRLTLPVIHGCLLTTCHLHLAPPWHAASICFSWRLRDVLLRKNCCSFGFCPNYVPPPNLDNAKNDDLSDIQSDSLCVRWGEKDINIQPKKQFKVQNICICEEVDQKYRWWECTKNSGRGLPRPSFWTKSKRRAVSPQNNVPNIRHFHIREHCISKGLSKRNL